LNSQIWFWHFAHLCHLAFYIRNWYISDELRTGIGGDYPMSAVITSEFATVNYRGMMIAAVFAMQGIGILVAGIVTVSTLSGMESQIRADPNALDVAWRVILGFGIVPAALAVYFRLTIPETPRFTVDVVGDASQAEKDMEAVLEMNQRANVTSNWVSDSSDKPQESKRTKKEVTFWEFFSDWKNGKILLGTAYCWFALDVAWYGLSLNQATILKMINYNGSNSASIYDSMYQKALGALIVACMGTVPGYWFTVALVEKMGRKPIQYLGFAVITVILAALSIGYSYFSTNQVAFISLYTIANFFFNFGPNQTTFIIPGEVFPTNQLDTVFQLLRGNWEPLLEFNWLLLILKRMLLSSWAFFPLSCLQD
jgi:PHS family inorganic phosphate transporter-like MFS transporter